MVDKISRQAVVSEKRILFYFHCNHSIHGFSKLALADLSECGNFSGGTSTVFPSGCSETTRREGFRTPADRGCGSTQACGMQMTGPPRAGVSRPTGARPPSGLTTVTSGPRLARGSAQWALTSVQPVCHLTGGHQTFTADWVTISRVGWKGWETTTWSMITARMARGSIGTCPLNASNHNTNAGSIRRCPETKLLMVSREDDNSKGVQPHFLSYTNLIYTNNVAWFVRAFQHVWWFLYTT